MPEPTRGCCALCHIQYCSKCISAPTYKDYLLLLKSTEFTAFGRVLANSANFVTVNIQNSEMALAMSILSSDLESFRSKIYKKSYNL